MKIDLTVDGIRYEDEVRELDEAAQSAAEGTDPPSDLNADAEFRRHLCRALTGRAQRIAAT